MEFVEYVNRFTDCKLELNAPLFDKCGYKTGGRAKYFLMPHSVKSLAETVSFCKQSEIKTFILANGSNVLFSDFGFDGAVISTIGLKGIKSEGETVTAFCGEKLSSVCAYAQKHSLSGLENFCGIPGTIGGAAVMNAGAFGKNFSAVVDEITVLKDGKIRKYFKEECGFSYRKSRFKNYQDEIVLSVKLRLKKDEASSIIKREKSFMQTRLNTQPQGKSCGSVFMNPKGEKAAVLIEKANLKGFKIGGAYVSDKHANFILTENKATSADVFNLIETIKKKVYLDFGVHLKEEIIYAGEFK